MKRVDLAVDVQGITVRWCWGRVTVGQQDRLALAKQIGAIPMNTKDGEIGDQIREATGGWGADCGAECIGYQCHNSKGKGVPNLVMNALVDAVKAIGYIGVVGIFVPQDPGSDDKLAQRVRLHSTWASSGSRGRRWGQGSAT